MFLEQISAQIRESKSWLKLKENTTNVRDEFLCVHTYAMFFQLEKHHNTEWNYDREASNKNKGEGNKTKIVSKFLPGVQSIIIAFWQFEKWQKNLHNRKALTRNY